MPGNASHVWKAIIFFLCSSVSQALKFWKQRLKQFTWSRCLLSDSLFRLKTKTNSNLPEEIFSRLPSVIYIFSRACHRLNTFPHWARTAVRFTDELPCLVVTKKIERNWVSLVTGGCFFITLFPTLVNRSDEVPLYLEYDYAFRGSGRKWWAQYKM